jgi:hypothetical protein
MTLTPLRLCVVSTIYRSMIHLPRRLRQALQDHPLRQDHLLLVVVVVVAAVALAVVEAVVIRKLWNDLRVLLRRSARLRMPFSKLHVIHHLIEKSGETCISNKRRGSESKIIVIDVFSGMNYEIDLPEQYYLYSYAHRMSHYTKMSPMTMRTPAMGIVENIPTPIESRTTFL